MEDPVVKEIAEKHNATPAQVSIAVFLVHEVMTLNCTSTFIYRKQVCISFLLYQGMVVIPKSVNPKRISENFKATQIQLDTEDIKRLKDIDKDYRLFKVLRGSWLLHKIVSNTCR